MKYLFNKNSYNKGTTLIEIIIYVALVSVLLSGFISFSYEIHTHLFRLNDDINDAQNI